MKEYITESQMQDAILDGLENAERIASVMKKARAGERITIAVLGGSITEGCISEGSLDNCLHEKKTYAEILHDWWKETFPNTEIAFVNAGIGATNSYLGVHRLNRDVLAHEPDLVLVEFSVNDVTLPSCKDSYDSLVRAIALSDRHPAILLLFMSETTGRSKQDIHYLIGHSYHLPMLSYKNVMDDMIEKKLYTPKELAQDEVHPTAIGHRMVGEVLWKYLNRIYEKVDSYGEAKEFAYEAVTRDKYSVNASILDNTNVVPVEKGTFTATTGKFIQFVSVWKKELSNDWTNQGGDGNLTFEIYCKNLGIMYHRWTDKTGGQFEVLVDGKVTHILNADCREGWANYVDWEEVFASDKAEKHRITIRKSGLSKRDEFSVLGLLVSE